MKIGDKIHTDLCLYCKIAIEQNDDGECPRCWEKVTHGCSAIIESIGEI